MTVDQTEPVSDHPLVLAVGGSAGSVQPLVEIVRDLPRDLPAAVLVTIHIGEQTRLPEILSRAGPLRATQARDSEVLEHSRIYVAPPGRHLITRCGLALPGPGPRVNRHRPSVDVMFASAAEWVGPRAVAVVLSGVLDDGAVGAALLIKKVVEYWCRILARLNSPECQVRHWLRRRALELFRYVNWPGRSAILWMRRSRAVAARMRRGQNGRLARTWSRALIPVSWSRMSPNSPGSPAPIAAAA
jgi:CheB methylesterase